MRVSKKYVAVTARFDADGRMQPVSLNWEDGRSFEIDRILDARRAASLKAGGVGVRYTCMILGQRRYLFFEGDRGWFVEA